MKRRRPGATETFGISLTPEAKKALKDAAKKRHGGNVSALIEELAADLQRQEAFERLWAWYGGPELTDDERHALDDELSGKGGAKRKSKRVA